MTKYFEYDEYKIPYELMDYVLKEYIGKLVTANGIVVGKITQSCMNDDGKIIINTSQDAGIFVPDGDTHEFAMDLEVTKQHKTKRGNIIADEIKLRNMFLVPYEEKDDINHD